MPAVIVPRDSLSLTIDLCAAVWWRMRSDVLCGAPNGATAVICEECGAARWDGPDGQLQRRIIAALQTADQSATTYKQVSDTLTWLRQ